MQAQEKNIRGFNILELLVVIVIDYIISEVAYPNFSSWKRKSSAKSRVVLVSA